MSSQKKQKLTKEEKKGKRKETFSRTKSDIRSHPFLFSAYVVLRVLVITVMILQIFNREYYDVFLCALTLILFMIPSFVERRLHIDVPNTLEVLILLFIFSAEILGEIREYYLVFPFWDTMLHTINGFLMAAIGLAMVDILNRSKKFKVRLSPVFVAVVAFCFSMTIGVLWEFFEYGMDCFFHMDMQKDTWVSAISTVTLNPEGKNAAVYLPIESVVVNGKEWPGYLDIGLHDTMKDLLVNFIGALVFSVIGMLYIMGRGRGKFAPRFIPRLKENELPQKEEDPASLLLPVALGGGEEEPNHQATEKRRKITLKPIVKTGQGLLGGILSQDEKTAIFRGIPYAQPPVGELRFRRPQKKEPWEGILPCEEFKARCCQADLASMDFYGKEFYDEMVPPCSEDCLYLNIWAPADAKEGDQLPVLFWIHGGAFLHGCGTEKEFDGEGFAKKGVILVTINYRVNVFGFFAHPELDRENEEGVSGNYGIFDQLFALSWVRENISAFGGDPEKITIAGQSAGCMSVQTIISSPLSQGMLRGAILQSGGGYPSLRPTAGKEKVLTISEKLMEELQVTTVEELRKIPAEKLCEAAYRVLGSDSLGWTPHVDGFLLPDTTDRQAEKGEIRNVHYLIGSTGNDIGDGVFLQQSGSGFCENLLKLGFPPAYFYYFDRKLPGDQAGAFHSSELWYEFETYPRCWRPWEAWDKELSRIFSSYWANFVKNGDPNGPGLPLWEAYTAENHSPILLSDKVEMKRS